MRFFSPPEKPVFTERLSIAGSMSTSFELLLHEVGELERIDLLLAARLADLVVRRAQEVRVRHAGNLDRILEGEEDARLRALLRLHLEQILAVVGDRAAGDLVRRIPGEHLRERALARAVRPHDGVHFARRSTVRSMPLQNLLVADGGA